MTFRMTVILVCTFLLGKVPTSETGRQNHLRNLSKISTSTPMVNSNSKFHIHLQMNQVPCHSHERENLGYLFYTGSQIEATSFLILPVLNLFQSKVPTASLHNVVIYRTGNARPFLAGAYITAHYVKRSVLANPILKYRYNKKI